MGGIILKRSEIKSSKFSPIKTSKISDEVYKQLVSMIRHGQLKPGEKLPSEREMASDLGISRQSLREALYRAKIMGLIEVRQGEGSFVLSSAHESLQTPLVGLLEEEVERIFEFFEIRKLIEGWCAEKASTVATVEDLERMKQILKKMEAVLPSGKTWEEVDMEFHLCIAAATHNVIAMHIMEALRESFDAFFRFRKVITKSEKKDLLWHHHNEVYKAINQRNASMARQKIVDHLNFIERKIREDIGNM